MIVDSGSTKGDWCLATESHTIFRVQTQGINPVHMSAEKIFAVIESELLSSVPDCCPSEIYFYGSGVLPALKKKMCKILKSVFYQADVVCSESDLLGAARALLGKRAGVACILGTGSNSCYYDGNSILKNTPPLGYILGDEGGGASLGIAFLNALYKGLLPCGLKDEFEQWLGMNYAQIIHRVYREPQANRWLASLSPFISEKCHGNNLIEDVKLLIISEFKNFIRRNIEVYYNGQNIEKKVSAVGSIAHYYRPEFEQALNDEGYVLGAIHKSPLNGLLEFHGCSVYSE